MKLNLFALTAALLASTASVFAADLPFEPIASPAPVQAIAVEPVAPINLTPDERISDAFEAYDWNGFSIGVHGMWGKGDANYFDSALSLDTESFGGGVEAGYDFQHGALVTGLAADISYLPLDATSGFAATIVDGAGVTTNTLTGDVEQELQWLSTVRGRVGYAFQQAPVMVYGTGGFAFGQVKHTASGTDVDAGGVATAFAYDEKKMHYGYTIGAGAKYAINDSVALGMEYQYVDLGKEQVFDASGYNVNSDATANIVKFGISTKF